MQHTESIAERAHALWEAEGRPDGRDQEFWYIAEAQLRDERQADEDGAEEILPLAAATLPLH